VSGITLSCCEPPPEGAPRLGFGAVQPREIWKVETKIPEGGGFGGGEHSGWVVLRAPGSQPPPPERGGADITYKLKLTGRRRAMRVRAVRVFGGDRPIDLAALPSPSALLQQPVGSSPLAAEALQVFKRLTERVIFALDDAEDGGGADAAAAAAADDAQLRRAGSQNLREHMIGILFAGDTGKNISISMPLCT
jgi:hypothetical protein